MTFYPGVSSVGEATAIEVAAGQELDDVNLQLKRSKLARIRGTVENHYSFKPLNLMTVQLKSHLHHFSDAFLVISH